MNLDRNGNVANEPYPELKYRSENPVPPLATKAVATLVVGG